MFGLGGLVVAEDVGTAAGGLLNGCYFAGYWWRRGGPRGRRIGAAALVLLSAAVVVEAAFSEGLFWAQQGGVWFGDLSPGVWALVRLPLLVATLFISAIVLRRVLS